MSNRNYIFVLAAVSALAAAALAPTSASAMRGGFGGGRSFGGGFAHASFGHASFARIGSIGHSSSFSRGYGRSFAGRNWGHAPMRLSSVSTCRWHYCGPGTTPNPGPPPCLLNCGGHPTPPPCFVNCGGHLPPPIVWWKHHPHWGVGEYPMGAYDDGGGVAQPVAAEAAPTAGPCTCLTKTYLDDGSVLFKDVCTKEAALATPDELRAQAQGVSPKAQAN
jgi:hypothetical protein